MKKTKHALKRQRQRGFRNIGVDVLIEFGIPTYGPGNVINYHLDRKTRNAIEKALNGKVVTSDNEIITMYHR